MMDPMRSAALALALALAGCGGETCPDTVEPVSVSAGSETPHVTVTLPSESRAPAPPGEVERYRVPRDYAPTRGPLDAPVTLVAFVDFECPFCKRAQATLDALEERYAGRLRVVFRHYPLPFHQGARPAAEAAMEAYAQGGDAAFWRFHDLLFAESPNRFDRDTLLRIGRAAQLDVTALERALEQGTHRSAVEGDVALAQRLGVSGTPSFFLNGRMLSGAQPVARFAEVIDDELARAERLVEGGVAPAALYATLTWRGHGVDPDRVPDDGDAGDPAPPPPRRARRVPDPDAVYRVPLDGPLPQRGPDDALVTIVSFSDFQCPFCSRVLPTLEQVAQRYGQDVRLVWMNNPLPFHQQARPAANAALEAFAQRGDAAFWDMHDRIFANQRTLSPDFLEQQARELGLDAAAVRRAVDQDTHAATIDAQQRLARSLGASGTPNFFINGRNLRGAQPFAAFEALIDEELAKARQRVAQGTARAQVYEETIRDGATSPQTIEQGAPAARNRPDPDQVYTLAVPADAPRRGGRRPEVVIQEFADFQCPFCNRVQPTLESLLQEFGGRVQLVWRDYPLPFHQNAHEAAEAAREVRRQAGDEAFWRYHGLLFANPRDLERPKLLDYARQIGGVNVRRLERALEQDRHAQAVDDDMQAVRDAGARIGTPSFFIGRRGSDQVRLLQGAQPIEAFRTAIQRALDESP